MANLQISPQDRKIVQDLLAKIPRDIEILVFGSRASATAKPFSDLDLCLKGKNVLPNLLLADLSEEFSKSDLSIRVDLIDYRLISPEFQKVVDKTAVPFQ